jgi:hypothetical protein
MQQLQIFMSLESIQKTVVFPVIFPNKQINDITMQDWRVLSAHTPVSKNDTTPSSKVRYV